MTVLAPKRQWFTGPLLCVALVALGCGKPGTGGAAVSGTVNLDGKPLVQGAIKFAPVGDAAGIVTGTEIKDGRYELPANQGPAVGKNRVEITAVRKTGEKVQDPLGPKGTMIEMEESAVAPRFNSASELTVEITAGENTHNFDVSSK